MGKEVSLARKKKQRQSVLLVGAGIGRTAQETSCRDKGQKQDSATQRTTTAEIINTAAQGKSNAKTKGGNGRRRVRHREDNSPRQPVGETKDRNRTTGRSAEVLGIVWPDGRCEESPTKAHWMVGNTTIDRGTIFQCKYCYAVKWLPSTHIDAGRLTKLMHQYGVLEGYRLMLDNHRTARKLIAKIQDIGYLRKFVPEEQLLKVVAAVMADKEYPYEEE